MGLRINMPVYFANNINCEGFSNVSISEKSALGIDVEENLLNGIVKTALTTYVEFVITDYLEVICSELLKTVMTGEVMTFEEFESNLSNYQLPVYSSSSFENILEHIESEALEELGCDEYDENIYVPIIAVLTNRMESMHGMLHKDNKELLSGMYDLMCAFHYCGYVSFNMDAIIETVIHDRCIGQTYSVEGYTIKDFSTVATLDTNTFDNLDKIKSAVAWHVSNYCNGNTGTWFILSDEGELYTDHYDIPYDDSGTLHFIVVSE